LTLSKPGEQFCPVCYSPTIKPDFSVESWIEANEDQASPVHKFLPLMKKNKNYDIQRICQCEECGFRFADPYPADEALAAYYQEYYANDKYESKIDKKIKRSKRRIKKLKRGSDKTFLDVGCNVGTAVEAARICGLEACGIEIDAQAVDKAKDLFPQNEFHVFSVQEMAEQGRQFDIIHTTEVIEHVQDPHSFMNSLYRLLSPGGVLYLTTPDAGHFRTPADIRRWHEMKLPEHISLFTKPALRKLSQAGGYEKPHFQFNWKPGIRMIAKKPA